MVHLLASHCLRWRIAAMNMAPSLDGKSRMGGAGGWRTLIVALLSVAFLPRAFSQVCPSLNCLYASGWLTLTLTHAHAIFISTTTKPLPDSATNTDYVTLTLTAFTTTPICKIVPAGD
jgi:hypothetical protein